MHLDVPCNARAFLLVHENNTWQNSTANERFESVGRGCLDLARGSQNIGDPFATGAFATDARGTARVLMLSCILQRARWRRARTRCVFFPQRCLSARRPTDDRKLRHPTVAAHIMRATQPNWTKFMQTRRQTDISYKQWQKSYKIPDFHKTWWISLHSNELRGASSGQHRYIIPGLNCRPPIDLCSSCLAARSPDCREPRRYMLQRKG